MDGKTVIKRAGRALPWVMLAGVAGVMVHDKRKAGRLDTRRAWTSILWRTVREAQADDILGAARAIAFSGLLAIFPALAAFVAIYGLFADPHTAREHLSALTGFVPADALTLIGDQMVRIAVANDAGLSVTVIFGLLVSIWSANAGMTSLFNGLHLAFGAAEKHSYVRRTVLTLVFTIGMVAFFLLSAAAVIAAPTVLAWFGIGGLLPGMAWLRWPALLAITTFGLSILYRYGANRESARWRWISLGAVVASLLWMAASVLFSWYLTNFAHYQTTYGSLGAVFGFMIWLWLSSVVILLGAELNAEIERRAG